MQFLRSYRWGVILEPLEKIDPFSLFSVTSVGFMAIAALPARLGELARPYLISQKVPSRCPRHWEPFSLKESWTVSRF